MSSDANAGRAVFEAVADFGKLIKPGKDAEEQLKRVRSAGESIGTAVPADGGKSKRGLDSLFTRADELGNKFVGTGKKMTLGLTAPLTLIGAVSVKSFADFEKFLNPSIGSKVL